MNFLPSDLKRIVEQYIDPIALGTYCQLISNCEQFLIGRAASDLRLPRDLILEIWNYPENLYNLTPYDNYIRVSAYFGVPFPGAQKFLHLKLCYRLAVSNNIKEAAYYFGNLLHYEDKKIKSNLKESFDREGRFYQKRTGLGPYVKEYRKIIEGEVPQGNLVNPRSLILMAALTGRYKILEELVKNSGISDQHVEEVLFISNMVKGNVIELEDLFPELPTPINRSIPFFLSSISNIEKKISEKVLVWLVHKINIPLFLDGLQNWYLDNPLIVKFFALVYYYYPEQIRQYLSIWRARFFNLTIIPFYFYTRIKLGLLFDLADLNEIRTKVSNFAKVNYNPESVNILINVLLQNPNLDITKTITAAVAAQKLITKLRK